MNSLEIQNEMKNYKCFKGVYPRDLLPLRHISERPIAMILNTDNSSKPGEHWVALFIEDNNQAEYFDSFGFKPLCCEIKEFLKINKIHSLKYNKSRIQSVFSDKCGAFCILYLKLRCKHFSFEEFLKLFSNNYLANDLVVSKY